MTITINEEQLSYIKSLDSSRKQKEFLLTAIIENITSLGESKKISEYQILCDIKSNEIMSREKPKGIDLNISFLQESLDGDISLELCQDLKNLCVKFQNYEFASKFRQKEKDILDTFDDEKLLELVQKGTIQMFDLTWAKKRKISDLPSKKFTIEKGTLKEGDVISFTYSTTTAPSGNHFQDSIDLGLQGLSAIGDAYKKQYERKDELLKFDKLEHNQRNENDFFDNVVKISKFYNSDLLKEWIEYDPKKEKLRKRQELEKCFNESRLTHPMIGFKHETFEDYFKTIERKITNSPSKK